MSFYDPDDHRSVEKYSSAVTLSDMEIFVFPELMYSLVLANIMSPITWLWRDNEWFTQSRRYNEYKRLLRLRQFVMDNFIFNLDLDTWGLTSKEKEIERFKDIIDIEDLTSSNALFGYEGDKYYFDLDIRRHFGLDKYTSNIIPYWKTETLEAMCAFRHKPGYQTGAGECVSLSTLYAAMLFVNIELPLEEIFLMATPLHSQNFINVKGGILTNNRRLVTKSMWFNGTELSAKARRAIENEKITMVVNNSGYVHTLYPEATMDQRDYSNFESYLNGFLNTKITSEILAGFLRQYPQYQKCFQLTRQHGGRTWFIEIERVFHYEHSSSCKVGDRSQNSLLKEIEIDEFYPQKIEGRAVFNDLQQLLQEAHISFASVDSVGKIIRKLPDLCLNMEQRFLGDLDRFCRTEPALPNTKKDWRRQPKIDLSGIKSREEVVDYLNSQRQTNPVADLAFAAYRDLKRSPWRPFLKAAFERNPVYLGAVQGDSLAESYQKLSALEDESIYNGTRVAQPDEVWNFKRGDGLEKAVAFIGLILQKGAPDDFRVDCDRDKIIVRADSSEYLFSTAKTELDLESGLSEVSCFF